MSHREFLIVLAHTHACGMCRQRLLDDPAGSVAMHSLTESERTVLTNLKFADYLTPDALARAAGVGPDELDAFRDQAVVRLRHL